MDCKRIQEALSASRDGEPGGIDSALVADHVERCSACRAFASTIRALDVPQQETKRDITPNILAAIAHESDSRRARPLRFLLCGVAILQLLIAIPILVSGNEPGASTHLARHLASFDIAVGIGFLAAAWRPRHIAGMLPVAGALVAGLVATALFDLGNGVSHTIAEAVHVLEVVGLVTLVLLSREPMETAPNVTTA
ncbi:MAG: zf-HC2 domain-containing protein [Acidimicrobiia bacterium]